MKIAFLFLCRKNILHPSIWKKYFLSQDKSKYNIYIHPDVDENVSDDFFKEYEILEKKNKRPYSYNRVKNFFVKTSFKR